jgi:hypothetical protein
MKTSSPVARAALVMSVLALMVAIGGGAYAAVKLKKNAVKTKNIKDGAVTSPKIADGAITAGKLGAGAVTPNPTPRAFMHEDGSGVITSTGVTNAVATGNVVCIDLPFTPVTGGVSRGADSGGSVTIAQVQIGAANTASLCTAPNNDAEFQVPGAANSHSVWAWFD